MKTYYLANIINFVKPWKNIAIEQNGDWTPIDIDPAVDYYKHNDSAKKGQIRHRLATMEI
jgi:hypothetical protein